MIRNITIEREFGSGSAAISQELAKRLGWELWDQRITTEVAKLANVPLKVVEEREDRRDPLLDRLAKVFMRGSFERRISLEGMNSFDADHMVALMQTILEKVATTGNAVIVGRGAPYFLRSRVDTFNVFIYASKAEKLRRLEMAGRKRTEAEDLVSSIDRERALFVKTYFHKEWPCRPLYHLMINSKIGDENVIELVLHQVNILGGIRTVVH